MWVWMVVNATRRMVWGESLLYLNAIPVLIFQIVLRYPLRSLSALYEKKNRFYYVHFLKGLLRLSKYSTFINLKYVTDTRVSRSPI